jgi:eukaryotic-like serine/threonine-protein kinase
MSLEGLQLGQYKLQRLLGSGGMGEVYLAVDARINQYVAIKVSRTETSTYPHNSTMQDTVRLFQREARAIAHLDHPHILSLLSYGEENVAGTALIYIVMPYRSEGSFADWLQQRGKNELLPVQDIAYFIGQGAEALQYVHDNQIVHQDVKPSNFLLRSHDKHPQRPDLLLADFGIARLSTSTASISHAIRGTPAYMAPEQWSGEPVFATDQYALAVLAYELLAGHPPFAGRQEQVMFQHFHNQPLPPSTFNPQLSRDVNEVILKALSKHPEERFISIAAFADAFREAVADLDASTIIKVPARPHTNDVPLASPTLHHPINQTVPVTNPDTFEQITALTKRGSEPFVPPSSSFVPTATETHHFPSHNSQRGIPTGTAILLVGIALVLLFGGLGFFYLHSMNPSPSPTQTLTTNATTQPASATATANGLNSTPSVATTPPGTYVQLHHSYSGTASGYADGAITFTLNSEDLQGNVNMSTTFQQLTGAQKIAGYTCQGSVTLDRHLSLQCSNITDPTYVLTIQGYVFPDGHMEGTETATNTADPGYNHVYSWKVY